MSAGSADPLEDRLVVGAELPDDVVRARVTPKTQGSRGGGHRLSHPLYQIRSPLAIDLK